MGDRNQRWQVVELAYGAVRVRCNHNSRRLASWCCAWRNRGKPWWDHDGRARHDIRREPQETQ